MKAKVPDEISEMDASHVNRWICHEIGRMLRVSVTNITMSYPSSLLIALFVFMCRWLRRTGQLAIFHSAVNFKSSTNSSQLIENVLADGKDGHVWLWNRWTVDT